MAVLCPLAAHRPLNATVAPRLPWLTGCVYTLTPEAPASEARMRFVTRTRRASAPAQFLARSNSPEACNKAFDGMHPSFKQVPPSTAAPTP